MCRKCLRFGSAEFSHSTQTASIGGGGGRRKKIRLHGTFMADGSPRKAESCYAEVGA